MCCLWCRLCGLVDVCDGRGAQQGERKEAIWQVLVSWEASACAICGAGCVVWWTFVMGEGSRKISGRHVVEVKNSTSRKLY